MTFGKYTCANCEQEFDKPRSDEDAMEEAIANGFDLSKDEPCLVCDDCYNRIMTWAGHTHALT